MKKTKKFLVGLLSLVVMVVCPLSLTACDKECKKHTWGEWTETTAATCTQDGVKTRTCTKCPKTDTESIAATGHSYGTVTYVWAQDKSTCTAKRECSHDSTHVETETVDAEFVATISPTCEQIGYGHYKAVFANTAFTEQNTQDGEVAALGHDYNIVYTWTADKINCTATATCKNDANHKHVETRQSTYSEVTPATCETAGEGKFEVTFQNTLFSKQTALHIIPAKNHSYATPVYNWSKRVENGTVYAVCVAGSVCQNNLEHTITETKVVPMNITKEATCLETGNGTATITFENSIFGTRTENFVLEAVGHDLELDKENSVKATCKANGYDRYSCQRTDCEYHEDTPTTAEHSWVGVRDCENSRTCTVCNTTEAAYGHETIKSTELSTSATCTENGEDYFVCIRQGCDYHFTTPVIAKGHNIEGVTPTIRPVTGEDCKYVNVYVCKTCSKDVLGDTFTKHSHVARIVTPATCEESGLKSYTCSGCGDHYEDAYSADSNAHNYIEDTNNAGHFECEHCGDKKVVLGDKEEAAAKVETTAITQKSEVVLSEASITLDSSTLANAEGEVTMTANKFEGDDRNSILAGHQNLVDQIGDKPIYNFTMKDSTGSSVDFATSSVTITIPYKLGTNEDVDSIYVWFLGEDNKLETFKATYHDGNIFFTTNHFSHYLVVNLTPEQICEKEGSHIFGETTTVAPTCVTEGYTISICTRCGHSEKTEVVKALGHEFVVDTDNSTEATCTEAGLYKFVCTHTDCGLSYEATKPATGHSYEYNAAESTEATCSTPGSEVYTCTHTDCDDFYTVYLKTVEHEFEIVENVPAKCEQSGYKKYDCKHCDANYTEYSQALVHNYGEVGVYTPHTQTKVGYTTYTCEHCDGTKVVEDSVITHIPNVEHATCETDKICLVCLVVLENKESVAHKNAITYTPHTKTEAGYTTHTCTVCGHEEIFEDETVEHALGAPVYTPHTKTEAGYTTKTCTICGHEEVKVDETVEHILGAPVYTPHTKTEAGYTTKTCTVCGHEEVKVDETVEHVLGTPVYTPHTKTEVGYTTKTCTVCGHEDIVEDAEINHEYEIEHATCKTDKVCTICEFVAESHLDAEHTFADGVCSVCGKEEITCEHGLGNNELLTVDPTCEEEGYTYYVCDDCGEEVVYEILDATGHEGDIVCLRCDEEIISLEFFASVFENMNASTFTLLLNDVVLKVMVDEIDQEYKVNFAELYVGKDSAGKFYVAGTGNLEYSEVRYGSDISNQIIANIVISNGNLYLKAISDENNSSASSSSQTPGVTVTTIVTEEGVVHYAKMTLADLYSYALESMTGGDDVTEMLTIETLEVVYDWYTQTLTPFIENIATINEESYLKTIRIIANDLFSVDMTDDGYTFKVDSKSLSKLFDDLTTLSLKEYLDKRMGEGSFDNMLKDVIRMVISGETVGDVLDDLADKGLDVYAFIDVLDVLSQSLTGLTIDEFVEMMMSAEQAPEDEQLPPIQNGMESMEVSDEEVPAFSLKAIIASYEDYELREIILGMLSEDLEAEELEMIESYLYPENSDTEVEDMVVTIKVLIDNAIKPYVKDISVAEFVMMLFPMNKEENDRVENKEQYDETLDFGSKADEMVGEVVDGMSTAMEQIKQMLAMLDEFVSLGFTCTKDGYVSNVFASLNVPEQVEANFVLNIEKGDKTDVDYAAIVEEIETVTVNGTLDANAKAEFEAIGLNAVVEGGKVVEVSKSFTSTELENISVEVWDDGTIVEYKFTKFEFVYDLTNPQFAVTMGCSGVVSFDNLYKITKVVSYTATEYKISNSSYTREPMGYFEVTDEVIEEYNSFSFVYNTTTKEISYLNVSVYFLVDNGHYYIDNFRSADFGDEYILDEKLGHNFVSKSTNEVNDCKNGSTFVETIYECSICHQERTKKTITKTEGETVAHTYDDGVYTAHTKDKAGYTTYTCEYCGHKEVVFDDVVNHLYDDGKYTEHTKTSAGYTTYTCTDCGHEKLMYDSTVEHTLGDGVYTDHTATKPGYTTYTCTTCGHEEVVADDVLNHKMNDGVYTDHTQTKPGYTTYTCTICGHEEVEHDEAIKHNFVNGSCSVCHSSDCEHGLGDNELVSVDATCEEAGYTYYICDDCGDKVIHEEFEALGHAGDIICYHCEKEIISTEFFTSLLDNMKGNEVTLSISNAVLDVTDYDYDYGTTRTNLSLAFAELYFGKNSAGKLYAYGNIQATATMERTGEKATAQNLVGYVVITNGKLYIKATLDNVDGMGSVSVGNEGMIYEGESITEIIQGNDYYVVLTLDSFANYALKMMGDEGQIPSGITLEMVEVVYDWYTQTLTPFIENIYTINKTSYAETVKIMLNDLFSVEVKDNGYTFKVDSKSISRLFNDISTLSVKDYFDKRMGENAFDNMLKSVIKGVITGKTVGDVLDDLAAKGLDIYALIDVADALVQSLSGGMMTLDQLIEMMMAEAPEASTPENGNDEYIDENGKVVIDGNMIITQETTEEVPAFSLKAMIESYEEMELRDILFGVLSSSEIDAESLSLIESLLYPDLTETTLEDSVTAAKTMIDQMINPIVKDVTILELLVVVSSSNQENVAPDVDDELVNNDDFIIGGYEVEDGKVGEDEVGEVVDEMAYIIEQMKQMIAMLDEFASFGFTCTKDGFVNSVYLTVSVPEIAEIDVQLDITKGQVTNVDYDAFVESVEKLVESVKIDSDNISVFEKMGFVAGYNSNKELETITYTLSQEELEYARDTDYKYNGGVEYKYITTYTSASVVFDLTDAQYMVEGGCNGFIRPDMLYKATVEVSYSVETTMKQKEYSPYENWEDSYNNGYHWNDGIGYYKEVEVSLSKDYFGGCEETYLSLNFVCDNGSINSINFYLRYENNYIADIESEDYEYQPDKGHNYLLVDIVEPEGHACEVLVEEYYECSDCGKTKIIYRQAGHKYKVDYVLTDENGTCEDGLDRIKTCIDCGHVEIKEKYQTYHCEEAIYGDRNVHGFEFEVCPCGQEFSFYAYDGNLYDYTCENKDNGYSNIYTSNDGTLAVEEYYDYSLGYDTYYIYVNDELVATYVPNKY